MPRVRTVAALTTATLLVGVGGYAAADVYDLVPGVLTIDRPVDPAVLPDPEPEPEVTGLVEIPRVSRPGPDERASGSEGDSGVDRSDRPDPSDSEVPAVPDTAAPDPAVLATVIDAQLAQPGFFDSAAVIVADAATGETLYERQPDLPVTPASTQKLLSGAAVLMTLDPESRFTTSVVRTGADTLALVAGGDTMLAPGHGDPAAIEGHAGLADLAEQVVARLGQDPAPPEQVTVSVDMSYAAGPRYSPNWNMADIAIGYNQGVTMIGLAGQRPRPFHPSPTEPEKEAVAAFAAALTAAGLPATVAAEPVLTTAVTGPRIGFVRSATVAEVTGLAMDDSDNALTEALARQASAFHGGPTDFAGVTEFIIDTVASLGIDTTGTALTDASGMSYDQLVPARVISDLILKGTTGAEPRLQPLVADLPVAGLSGTLHDRFHASSTRAVAGIPRAKTGTINATIALAGTTMTRDGRLLSFVTIAYAVPREGRLEARLALDRLTAALTECGCS